MNVIHTQIFETLREAPIQKLTSIEYLNLVDEMFRRLVLADYEADAKRILAEAERDEKCCENPASCRRSGVQEVE